MYENDEDFYFPPEENCEEMQCTIPVDNEHFLSEHLARSKETLLGSQTQRDLIRYKKLIVDLGELPFLISNNLDNSAPAGHVLTKENPRWLSQSIYKNDFRHLKILKLKNLEYSGCTRSIPRIRSFSDSAIE